MAESEEDVVAVVAVVVAVVVVRERRLPSLRLLPWRSSLAVLGDQARSRRPDSAGSAPRQEEEGAAAAAAAAGAGAAGAAAAVAAAVAAAAAAAAVAAGTPAKRGVKLTRAGARRELESCLSLRGQAAGAMSVKNAEERGSTNTASCALDAKSVVILFMMMQTSYHL